MPTFRRAKLADAEVLTETMQLGFASYRAWAPRGWEPPPPEIDLARIRAGVERPDTWCLIAEDEGAPAGHVAFTPARTRAEPREPVPGLAHLWLLFVR
jgi:hypothetical protein